MPFGGLSNKNGYKVNIIDAPVLRLSIIKIIDNLMKDTQIWWEYIQILQITIRYHCWQLK